MSRTLFALLAGVAFVLSFAPFEFPILVFPCLAVLFWLWLDAASSRQAFTVGWAFGLGQFGAGVSWIYVSLNTFGNMAPPLAGVAVLLLVMGLALFPATVGLFQHLFKKSPVWVRLLGVIIPTWVLAEWVREWLFTGLPWLAAGYSQAGNFLSAWAPLGGVYLVSLIVALLAAALVLSSLKRFTSALFVAVACLAGTYFVSTLEWTHDNGDSLSVKLVQGNVAILDKWDPSKSGEIINRYIELGETGVRVDLVIWPEAAAPVLYSQLPQDFWDMLEQPDSPKFMFGVVERDSQTNKLYNSVVTTGLGGSQGIYRKIHLVPFGEYLPLEAVLTWLLDYLQIPMSNLSPYLGDQSAIVVNGVTIGVSICYEDAFANVVRKDLPGAGVLVNISEDAWFGDSLAPHQRLQMAQMRAKENGRTMIRVSNNGLSSIINYNGEIQALAPQFETAVLDGRADIRTGVTPFSTYGHLLVLSLLLALFLPAILSLQWVHRQTGDDSPLDRLSEQK